MKDFLKLSYLLLVCSMLLACGNKQAIRYYLLETEQQLLQNKSAESANLSAIGIGPINFAEYLDRPQLVIRNSASELLILDKHRWAEPLQESFSRILTRSLVDLLPAERIIVYPSRHWSEVKRQVLIDVMRFDSDTDGNIELEVQLTVIENGKPASTVIHQPRLRFTARAGAGYADMALVMGRLVQQLAEQLRELLGKQS